MSLSDEIDSKANLKIAWQIVVYEDHLESNSIVLEKFGLRQKQKL